MTVKFGEWVPTSTMVGWLSPDNVIHPCGHYEHFDFFKDMPEFSHAYEQYAGQLECNQDIMNDHLQRCAEKDEHPGMHVFAGIDDDARDEFYATVYAAGWVRFGFFESLCMGKITKSAYLDLNGSQKRLEGLKRDILKIRKDFGIRVDGRCLIEVNKYYGKYRSQRVTWD